MDCLRISWSDQGSQSLWFRLYSDQHETSSSGISSWNSDASRLNSTDSRVARAAGVASNPPATRQITQDSLRSWEKSAREASVICNQAAGFNRCLFKVQNNIQQQLKTIQTDQGKGKSSSKVSTATGADFTKGLKSRFRLKFKTLVLSLC